MQFKKSGIRFGRRGVGWYRAGFGVVIGTHPVLLWFDTARGMEVRENRMCLFFLVRIERTFIFSDVGQK